MLVIEQLVSQRSRRICDADGPDWDRDMLHVDDYLWLKMGLTGAILETETLFQLTEYRG